jgi:hypothetical protein
VRRHEFNDRRLVGVYFASNGPFQMLIEFAVTNCSNQSVDGGREVSEGCPSLWSRSAPPLKVAEIRRSPLGTRLWIYVDMPQSQHPQIPIAT